MKKLFLALAAFAGTYGITNANTVTVNNLTGCTYTLNFSSVVTTVGPGITTVSSTAVSGDLIACKIIYNDGLPGSISIGVGLQPDFPPYANSAMFANNPPCVTNGFYSVAWSQASSAANATLVIF